MKIGQFLWIELEVRASEQWCGYLSFSGRTDRRAYVRRRVTVSERGYEQADNLRKQQIEDGLLKRRGL